MGGTPRVGDFMIRPSGPFVFGVFRIGADMFEHPFRVFEDYVDALNHATHIAEESGVDVWDAPNHYVTSHRVKGYRITPAALDRNH